MEIELTFKEETGKLLFEEEGKSQQLTVSQKKTEGRYTELLAQYKKASAGVEYIHDGSKRRHHVFAFAENYHSVSAKECRNFYKKNPEEFKRQKEESGMVGLLSTTVASVLIGFGLMCIDFLGTSLICLCMYLFTALFTSIGVAGLGHWAYMTKKGPKNWNASPADFLWIFESDKNLKKLWSKKCKNKKMKEWWGTQFEKDEKEWKAINAYVETAGWLKQWSRGDVNNIRLVEWKALCGIAHKYGKYLTPVDSAPGSSASKIQ